MIIHMMLAFCRESSNQLFILTFLKQVKFSLKAICWILGKIKVKRRKVWLESYSA